jgi:hypothetical protein
MFDEELFGLTPADMAKGRTTPIGFVFGAAGKKRVNIA